MPGKRQNRPQSDDIVDLHVFLVPLELWIGKYRTAYNNALLQSTSAGFIRIHAEMNLIKTRREIIEQLEPEVVPDEFVFLRSVGRCLAAVNQQQEGKLKAKHFLPPIAFSPELFLLPCSHSDLTSILATDNKAVYVTGQTPLRLGSMDISHLDSYAAFYDSDTVTDNGEVTLPSVSKAKSYAEDVEVPKNEVNNESLEDGKADLLNAHTSEEQEDRDIADKNEIVEKWRAVVDQSEMLHQVPKVSKKVSSMSEKLRDKTAIERTQSALPAIQVIEPEALPASPGNTRRVGIPTPLPSGKVVAKNSSHLKKQNRPKKEEAVDNEENARNVEQDVLETNDDSDDLVQHEMEDTSGDDLNDVVGTTSQNDDTLPPEKLDFDNEKDMASNVVLEKPESIPDPDHNTDENVIQAENEEERTEVFASDSSGSLQILSVEQSSEVDLLLASPRERSKSNRERQLKMELEKKRLEEKKKNAAEGASKMMQEMDDLLRKKKLEEEKRKKQEEEVKKMMKAAEEEKKREIERLKEEVRLAKEEKAEVQKRRETIVKLARELQTKVHVKANRDTNMWKKKYQNEAERTTELEEELNRLRTDLDVQHKKLLGTFDNKAYSINQKVARPSKAKTPSQLSNQKIQLRRLQQDVESLRQRVDETRVKLSAERKMRAIAFQELKELRNQALEKKINAALSSRRFPGVRPIDGNVTA